MNEVPSIFVAESAAPKPEPLRVFTYIRVSGKGQLSGDGPERQRDSISAFCAAHNLDPRHEFFERAVSGTIDATDRPAFAGMLEHIDSGDEKVAAIVVERMDRLARDLMVSEVLLAECRKRGIKVFSADQGLLVDMAGEKNADPTRVLIRQILGALSQWEKSMLVIKLRLARERIRRKKGKCEGVRKYGEKPGEQDVINLIHGFRSTLDIWHQPMEYKLIAKYLNESGFRNRSGGLWTDEYVRWLYHNTKPTQTVEMQ